MHVVYLVRGVSGSGKTTLAHELASLTNGYSTASSFIIAADDFMLDEHGKYVFEVGKLGAAHKKCFSGFCAALDQGINIVVVHNTFTTNNEIQPYVDAAAATGYSLVSLIVENRHGGHDIHGVPQATREAQAAKLRNNLVLL